MSAPAPTSRRLAMHPGPGGQTEWDRLGNGHLRTLVAGLGHLGWQVASLDLPGVLAGVFPPQAADVTHVHWTEQFALSVPQPAWLKALTIVQTKVAARRRPIGLINGFAQRHVRRLAALRPLVYQAHDLESNWLTPARSHLLDRAFKRAFLRAAQAWVVHESGCLPLLADIAGCAAPPHAVCPLGSYAEFHGPAVPAAEARARLGLNPDETIFLFAGYAGPRRNPRTTAAAFAAAGLPRARLLVASLNAADYLRNDDPRIRLLTGLLADDTLRDLYCASDWIVMPGRAYLTSAVVRTALSYHRPVICRDFGCQGDMARAAALWLEDDSETALARALRMAAALPPAEMARLRAAASDRDAERNWRDSIRRHSDLMSALVDAALQRQSAPPTATSPLSA